MPPKAKVTRILDEDERAKAWEGATDTMRNILSADVYEPDVYHQANIVDRRERRARGRASTSADDPTTSSTEPDNARDGGENNREEGGGETDEKKQKECAEREKRFQAFVERQDYLREELDPVHDRLTRRNCTTLETFETLSDRRCEPNPPKDETCWILRLGSDILECIALAIICGERTRSSDEKMLQRLLEQLAVYGKEMYVVMMGSASFWRAAESAVCLVHKANQPIIAHIMGLKPPDIHRKHADVFGLKWRCVGTSLPSVGASGEPLVELKRYGKFDTTHRGTAIIPFYVSANAPSGPIIEDYLANCCEELRAECKGASFDYTKLGVITLPLHMVMTAKQRWDAAAVPIFHFRSNSYVKVDGQTNASKPLRPVLYFVPVEEGEKTTEQMGLLLPPTSRRHPAYAKIIDQNNHFEILNSSPRRYKMPEMFDFMLRYAIRVQNERFHLAWEKRFQAWLRFNWGTLQSDVDDAIPWAGGDNSIPFSRSEQGVAQKCKSLGFHKSWFTPAPYMKGSMYANPYGTAMPGVAKYYHNEYYRNAYVVAATAFLDGGARQFYMSKHPLPCDLPENDNTGWAEVLRLRKERLQERQRRRCKRTAAEINC